MPNAIAILFHPGRLLVLCLGLFAGYLALCSTMDSAPPDCEEISRVELID